MPEANSPSSPAPARSDDSAPADGSGPADDSAAADGSVRSDSSVRSDGTGTPPPEPDDEPEEDRPALTPRQARRIRIVLSAVVMLAVAVALVVRLESAPSVLTVGFYGVALILSGTAIALSRRGRTRVATAVLALGFVLVVFGEWLLGFSGGP